MSAGSPLTVCAGKRAFDTKPEAEREARDRGQRLYRCPFGTHWHLRSKISRRQSR